MDTLTISEVARLAGLRPSTIRYYEEIGILLAPRRISGQRRYDTSVLWRFAVIQRARQVGFSLDEIRLLFFGFRNTTPPSLRWRKLSKTKLEELDTMIMRIQEMRDLLQRMLQNCKCTVLEECGRRLLRK